MRNKIIGVNAVIVALVGLLAFVIVRASLSAAASNPAQLDAMARHDVEGAIARFQLDGLRAEHWLTARALDAATLDALTRATASARGDAATAVCDAALSAAKGSADFEATKPSIAFLLDASGKVQGRSGVNLDRGADLSALYPGLKSGLAAGLSGIEIWFNPGRNDQYLASWAPVRDSSGHLMGAIALGLPLNEELSLVSNLTSDRPIVLASSVSGAVTALAHSANATGALDTVVSQDAKDIVSAATASGHASTMMTGDYDVAADALTALAGPRSYALVVAGTHSLLDNWNSIPLSILGVMALGLVLVLVGGWLLGSYISGPINMLEEGLLAILNGQQDKRFELEHPDLGGLAFRIDQLLNQLMGIEEDNSDEDGRPSRAPDTKNFTDAMSVEDRPSSKSTDTASIGALAAESSDAYYRRLYGEYIEAKKALGEQTDHITEQAFVTRIQGMEKDASNKYGSPVRYQVQAREKEVVLLAVPLPG